MPSSYSVFELTAFPTTRHGETVAAPRQLPLSGMTDEPPKTELTLQRTIDLMNIDVYRGLHEFVVPRTGRAQGVQFTQYIEERRFPVYHAKIESVLLLKTNKDVATGAMKQMLKVKGVSGKRRKIDLDSIKPHIGQFKGVWFTVDDSANVSSMALFGHNVDKDLRFARATEEGEMYYIRFDYQFHEELIPIGISNDSNIVIYSDNLDEQLELELTLNVKTQLLDRATEIL